ncbi:MAG: hypothetical protein ABL903_01985 [Methylococcales bacterium]
MKRGIKPLLSLRNESILMWVDDGLLLWLEEINSQRFYLQEVVLRDALQHEQSFKTEALSGNNAALNGESHAGAIASVLLNIYAVNKGAVSKVDEEHQDLTDWATGRDRAIRLPSVYVGKLLKLDGGRFEVRRLLQQILAWCIRPKRSLANCHTFKPQP